MTGGDERSLDLPIDRRTVLKSMGVGLAAIALGGLTTGCKPVPQYAGIVALGNEYLTRTPAEANAEALAPNLTNPATGNPYAPGTDPKIMIAGLGPQILADFQDGRTITMTGHELSVTECRVAAYWALARGSATTTTTS